jgi:hypothetical protein
LHILHTYSFRRSTVCVGLATRVKAVTDAVTNVASTHLKLLNYVTEVRAECLPLHKTNQYRSSNNVALRNSPFHSDNTAQSQLEQHHWETYQRHWDEVPVQKLAKRAVCTLHHCQCTHKHKINSRTATIMVLALLSPPILHALANNAFQGTLTSQTDEKHVRDGMLPSNRSERSDWPPQCYHLPKHVLCRQSKVQSTAHHPVATHTLQEQHTKALVNLLLCVATQQQSSINGL